MLKLNAGWQLEFPKTGEKNYCMPKFLIERDWPGAGLLSQNELIKIAQQSCEVLSNMQARVHWVNSYVTDNNMYCVYIAPDEDALLEHASYVGFSARKITMVKQIIDPVTAEEARSKSP